MARAGDRVVLAENGLLLLPTTEEPECVVYFDPEEGWMVDDGEAPRAISDGDSVRTSEENWTLYVASTLSATFEAQVEMPELADLKAAFSVSRDEEWVQVTLLGPGGWRVELEPRVYHYMLLTLARIRLADHERGLSDGELGWVHREELARMLRVSPRTLTVHLCRAHRQVGDAGVLGATSLFEHRPSVRQLRLRIPVSNIGNRSEA